MDAKLREVVEAIQAEVKILREKSERPQDAILQDVTKQVMASLEQKMKDYREQSSMKFDIGQLNVDPESGVSEYGKRFNGLCDFLVKCREKSPLVAKSTMTEGTDAQGGYTVPTEQSSEIIKLIKEENVLPGLARNFPMKTWKRTFPKQLTQVTVTWTGEGVTKSKSKPTFGQLTQTAKKLAVIVKMTDELLDDTSVEMQAFVREVVAYAMGQEIDRVGFVGNTGGGDPFDGVLYATGVNAVTMGGASITGDDIIDLIQAVPAAARIRGTLVTSTAGETLMMKLKDTQGQYLWSPPNMGVPARIWNKPYKVSDQIPTNLGAGTDETAMLFGDWKRYFFHSIRKGLTVKVSQEAADWVDSALDSAFTQDETWVRFVLRLSEDVALANAFSKMQVK
jgi:HK97 family phage major capsid protein